MPALRFPILLLRDAAGFHTAALVEDGGDVAAFAPTAADARGQLRDHLERRYKANPWLPEPDFADAKLSLQKVDVRPEYRDDGRAHPCGATVALRVAVVTGKTSAGLNVAALPTLGVRFTYYAEDDLRPLVAQFVQARAKGLTPAQVAALLAPSHVELDDVVVQAARERRERVESADLADLAAVADPLGARELRNRFSRAWERDELVGQLVEALRKEAAPILLVGEGGVGKTTVLADAVRRIERDAAAAVGPRATPPDTGELPAHAVPRTHRFWLTSAPRLIAGMQYLGMWQERVESVVAQLASVSGVLCAENLLDLVRTGGRGPGDSIGSFLAPYLRRGELRLVAEATPAELDALRRLAPAVADLFRIVAVPPMWRGQAVACLAQAAAARRQNQRVEFDRGVVETVYRLFARFMPYQPFPGAAVNFLGDCFDQAARAADAGRRVTPDDAVDLFARRTGLPELFLRDERPLDARSVVATLHRDVIGQERACEAAASVVTTFKAGLNDPGRPLGVLLFAGPTGVGKTQLAQSLARFLFGADGMNARMEDRGSRTEEGAAFDGLPPSSTLNPPSASSSPSRLIRLDMSEYNTPDAADRLLGSADTGPAEWIQKVRQQPFTVVLLDEIEKASPDVFDLLLGVFDEGRLTDPWGRLTHFTSAVIVMTTNLGVGAGEPFGLSRGTPPTPAQGGYEGEAMGFFRPEFYNRIDAVVTFDPLSPQHVRAIAAKELADLSAREGLAKAGLRLEWTDRLLDHLAAEGFDPRYGARPLQRALETLVVTPLARFLVEHATSPGARLLIDLDEWRRVTINPVS